MATAATLITAAFQKIAIDTPTTAQISSALNSLNTMISLWGADSLYYVPYSTSKVLTAGTSEYTVGSGGDINIARPMGLKSMYLRDSDGYDWPVKAMSGQDYNDLFDKDYSSVPTQVYFLPEYPLAKLIFNRAPDEAYTAYIEFMANFTEFALTTTAVTLPNEYKEALIYNLAVSLAEDWDRKPNNTVMMKAEMYKGIIERYNASQRGVPKARFDFFGSGSYDIVNDI